VKSLVVRVQLLAVLLSASGAAAQDLVPGAYTPAPASFNVVTVAASTSRGDLSFDPSLPVQEGYAKIGVMILGYNRTLSLWGRSASVGAGWPIVIGHAQGLVFGQFQEASRSGPGDIGSRIAINLYGAPAMTAGEFASYRQVTIVGVSLNVSLPAGQYDNTKVINIGAHRWSIRPELGVSRRKGRWTFEGDAGVTFYTEDASFVSGPRSQAPIVGFQGHLIYTVRTGLWVAADGNFWKGGRLTTNGVEGVGEQRNSRLGVTFAVPVRHQQFRIAYSFGAYTTIGGDFSSVGVSYSYVWRAR
jgi:outer membrane putative beta-barrel porin/alpha-amylase